jgi:hypothetical protein
MHRGMTLTAGETRSNDITQQKIELDEIAIVFLAQNERKMIN